MLTDQFAQQEVAKSARIPSHITPPTMTDRLKQRREELIYQLAQVEGAIEALESSPEVQRAVDAIARLGHF